ncbi:hypothetical protein KBD71_05660 [Candidatus Woesebacteria bacterium]|nr:hypothetical protein [Candidatus Woesebacteria bacterium]
MLGRLEGMRTGVSPFRWDADAIAAIAFIQPRRSIEADGVALEPLAERKSEPESPQRNADVVFLSSIAAIVSRSDKSSYKFQQLVELLRPYVGEELILNKSEEIPEAEYNWLSSIQARPAMIAALKADASLLFSTVDDRERFKQVMSFVQSQATSTERMAISRIGSDALFRGNDVMARMIVDGEQSSLFKPAKQIDTKEKLFDYLQCVFHIKTKVPDSNQTTDISMEWIAAEALFAARDNIGVTKEAKVQINLKRPDAAFLYCYLFGTRKPDMPEAFRDTAAKFDSIFNSVRLRGDKDESILERLRGWTPEEGAKNPEQVNGGFQGDTIFFEELLFDSINGIRKDHPDFQDAAANAVSLVRGAPVLFMETLRTLADILSRNERNLPFPENESTAQIRQVLSELRETFSNHPNRDQIFAGRWFDASEERNIDYHIDMDAALYYAYASRALLLSDTMLQ